MAGRSPLRRRRRHCKRINIFPCIYSFIFFSSFQTGTALESFVFAMALNPDVLRKAQKEIDTVVGQGRLPLLSDIPSLPYVEAVMKETLRWNAILPIGNYAPPLA